DLTAGCPDQAPFDVILFDGAVSEILDAVSSQLAEGGRLVAVVSGNGLDRATLVTRHRSGFSRRELFDAGTPPLPGFERKATFVF
ncbi:MAG: protein-L-isoaspartate O-methyltransferase, partial [Rhodospirillales bacterium]